MNGLRIFAALQRQRFAVRNLPVLTDRMDQFGQSELSVPERFADTVFHHPAFQINGYGVPQCTAITPSCDWRANFHPR
jgi:hypothetical protein